MDAFLRMDVFFFVATVSVFVMTIAASLIAYKIWKILGHLEKAASMLEIEADIVKKDIARLRERLGMAATIVFGLFTRTRKKKPRHVAD
jgi:hypothetical protein